MKALIFNQPNNPILSDIETPHIADTEVLVRSRRVGICHSDYELLSGNILSRSPIR